MDVESDSGVAAAGAVLRVTRQTTRCSARLPRPGRQHQGPGGAGAIACMGAPLLVAAVVSMKWDRAEPHLLVLLLRAAGLAATGTSLALSSPAAPTPGQGSEWRGASGCEGTVGRGWKGVGEGGEGGSGNRGVA